MGEYTFDGKFKHEEKVRTDVKKIVDAVLQECKKNVRAIVLTGGFGRGEGSIIRKKGKYFANNDYDLLVILRKRWKFDLSGLGKKLAEELGVDFVDLGIVYVKDLKRWELTTYHAEVKYCSKIVWGDENILSEIPDFDLTKISLREATRWLFNRGGSLLLLSDSMYKENSLFTKNQISKACLAMGDSVLIKEHKYKVKYAERFDELRRLKSFSEEKKIKLWYGLAIMHKKHPGTVSLPKIDDILPLYSKIYWQIEELRLGKKFSSWQDYSEKISNYDDFLLPSGLSRHVRVLRRYMKTEVPLFKVLPLLLFDQSRNSQVRICRLLHLPQNTSRRGCIKKFIEVWHG